MKPQVEAAPVEAQPVGAARRVFIGHDEIPTGALTWEDPQARQRVMSRWRRCINFLITTEPRPVKAMGILMELIGGTDIAGPWMTT